MKRSEPLRVDEIIEKMVTATGLRPQFQAHSIENVWPDVVGKHINAFTSRVYVRERTLHVHITSAPLKEELGYMRELLVKQLNRAAGADVINNIAIH